MTGEREGRTTPKDDGRLGGLTGERDGLRYEERSVEAKDDLLSWIAAAV
jgi:hypothetical protein